MYCNIENSFLGKKLNNTFYNKNRNKVANLIEDPLFKQWFGKGKLDVDGNPILDSALSFTNEKGEKKTVFDFSILFENLGEVKKTLAASPGVRLYRSELFVNNTAKDISGNYKAIAAANLVNTINYYYPKLLSYDIFQRKGLSPYSKDKSIPLPIIKVNEEAVLSQNAGFLFSVHETQQLSKDSERFSQLRSFDQLLELKNSVDEFRTWGLTDQDLTKIAFTPEVTEETYNELAKFFLSISPEARLESVQGMSANGVAYINEMLIQLEKGYEYRAMPEEVAHFFVELLPASSQLKKDLIANITNFAIYGTTLAQYRDNPEYQIDGRVNYDKIKREAAAKLIAEYIYAESTGDQSRIAVFTKTKDSFIKRWWDAFLKWITNGLIDRKKQILKSYLDATLAILNQEVEYLTLDEIGKSAENNIFFSEPGTARADWANSILTKVTQAGKLDDLQGVINVFRNDLRKNFIKIVKDPVFTELKKELQKENGEDTEINHMSELFDIMKKVNVTAKEMHTSMTAENQVLNIAEFIAVIADMERLSKAISMLTDLYEDDENYISHIEQLQFYREMYSNFRDFVNRDLTGILIDSMVEDDIITSINNTITNFATVDRKVLKVLTKKFERWMNETLGPQNTIIVTELARKMENLLTIDRVNPAIKKTISDIVMQYIKDMSGNPTELETFLKQKNPSKSYKGLTINELAKLKLINALEGNVPTEVINSRAMSQVFDEVDKLFVSSKSVHLLLNGLGKDIDQLSQFSHLVTAAIKNHDTIVANVAKYIIDKKAIAQNDARLTITDYQSKVDEILKKLKNSNIDEYQAGEMITYIDEVIDESKDKNGKRTYKDGKRKIAKFLNPFENVYYQERDRLDLLRREARAKWTNSDPNTPESTLLKKDYVRARKEYINFLSEWENSPYTQELQDFKNKWDKNEDFLDIKDRWDELSEQEAKLRQMYETDKSSNVDYTEIAVIIEKKKQLRNLKGKSVDEVAKIKLLDDYFEENSKFRVIDNRRSERNYKLAQNNYESRLNYAFNLFLSEYKGADRTTTNLQISLRKSMDPTTNIKYEYALAAADYNWSEVDLEEEEQLELAKSLLMNRWVRSNRVRVRNQAYYDARDTAIAKIDAFKSKYKLSNIEQFKSYIFEEMNNMLFDRKDLYGQRNPALFTPAEKAKFLTLEDGLNDINTILKRTGDISINTYAILDEVKNDPQFSKFLPIITEYENEVNELYDFINQTTPIDIDKITQLKAAIRDKNEAFIAIGIVTKDQIDTINAINELWSSLGALSDKVPTQAYMEKMEELIPLLHDHHEEAIKLWEANKSNKALLDEIENLRMLIEGLTAAIYGPRFMKDEEGNDITDSQLERIINNKYTAKNSLGVEVKVDFIKYIEYVEQGEGDPSYIESVAPELYDWFHDSHKPGGMYVDDIDSIEAIYLNKKVFENRPFIRRSYYNYSEPSARWPMFYDDVVAKKYRATKIKGDPLGKTDEERGFYKKQVSWRDTDNMDEWTVDNKGKYLPLSRSQRLSQGKTSKLYLNEKYYALQDDKSANGILLRDYLAISLKTYFEEQENKPDEIKGGYNLPVTTLDSYQRLKATVTNAPDRIKRAGQRVKSLFTKSSDIDAEDMVDGVDEIKDTNEMTQQIIDKVRKTDEKVISLGMNTKVPVERVNRNVLHAMTMYIHASKDFDTRTDLRPFIKGLIDVMSLNHISSGKNRTKIIDSIYKQMILEEQPTNITNQKNFRKFANIMMRMSGMKLTADVLGGAINYMQANINNIVESFAGKYIGMRNYSKGYMKASEMMASLFADYNKKSDYSFWTLMYQTFDFVQGSWIDDLSERSATKNKKFDWQRMLMYPRTNGELHAQSAMAIGIMDHTKVRNQIDGKDYPVWAIYKKQDGKLVLKEGFWEYTKDDEGNDTAEVIYPWNPINGTKFESLRGKIWSVNIDLHGNYPKINQTEASRYAVGKMAENMKRWFISGFQRRFGRETFDVNTRQLEEGYYTTAAMALWNISVNGLIRNGLAGMKQQYALYWKSPAQKANLKRFFMEMILCSVLYMIGLFAFGYDDDDPDKNKKLANNSWIENELLLLFMRGYAEQTAFIPVPPFGFTEMTRNLLDPLSVPKSAFMNAVGTGTLLFYQLWHTLGNDTLFGKDLEKALYYQKKTGADPIWPFSEFMGNKGDSKLVHYLFKTFGYTGSQMDPAYYLRNFQSMQNRLK